MKDLSVNSFYELMEEIVKENTDSLNYEMFKLDGEKIVSRLFENNFDSQSIKASEFGIENIPEILEKVPEFVKYLGIIIGSFNTAKSWFERNNETKKIDTSALIQEWENNLVKEGMSIEQSKIIAMKFTNDFKKLLER